MKTWKLHKQNVQYGGRYANFAPSKAENLAYHHNSRTGMKPSVFDPNQMVEDPTDSVTICPRCKSEGPALEHGDLAQCTCGLAMQLFGNGLSCWMGVWPKALA